MLNQETKKRIDSARDILVGKVPDPKAQVEQITTAMIYKFMDDMDKEAQELGGKARFFTNGYEKYSWTTIIDPKLGGHERLNLYAEAVIKMSENPHIPQLFRDIFKDAFLPYRSPETLSMFLKEINGFKYLHSEDLGDAFEYLLSVLGSQGDAGQFRTPRHIIDFIAEVIDPKKDESMLDPACGTAGFLIAAFKHILKQNKDKSLSPDDKKRLMDHIVGYDISPDMVKLSKVNMYLHGFPTPHIYEYDTLSSEDRWDETYDVIMANPPFMTPKGGIKPHKRFSVMANRAEILFVDYIIEHLNLGGKAGVVVPDGVVNGITTSSKILRKNLVENGLLSVVSLPAGVFNPYSGVKTYILFFNKTISKLSSSILFIRVDNDGYDLGANRRQIDKNDLPRVNTLIKKYEESILNKEKFYVDKEAIVVEKTKILETSDHSLSGERYIEQNITNNAKWPLILLGDICDFEGGSQPPKVNFVYSPKEGYVKFIQIRDFGDNGIETYIPLSPRNRICKTDDILIARYGASLGRICTGLEGAYNVALLKTVPNMSKILKEYLYYLLKSSYIQNRILQLGNRAAQAGIRPDDLKATKIYLPSINEQKKIISDLKKEEDQIKNHKNKIEEHKKNIDKMIQELCN